LGALGGAVAGIVALGGSALGMPLALAGGLSGFAAGAITQWQTNLAFDRPWYEGVGQSAVAGGADGLASGWLGSKLNPNARLWTRAGFSALTGAGVSGGTQIALNVVNGRPWDENLSVALAAGAASGVAGEVAGHAAHGLTERFTGWIERQQVQRALKQWENPDLSLAERFRVEQFLRKKGAEGLWQGGVADEGLGSSALYHGLTDTRLQRFQAEGLHIPSTEGYRGAGLYTTPNLNEAGEWAARYRSDTYHVLKFEIDPEAWQSLAGKRIDMTDWGETYRYLAEQAILAKRPELIRGFPRTQPEFDALIREAFPILEKAGPIQAVDYLHGEVPLPQGGIGYEYVFKSRYAIQNVLSDPLLTTTWIAGANDLTKWSPISFPRR
jgi:hypothetical protein